MLVHSSGEDEGFKANRQTRTEGVCHHLDLCGPDICPPIAMIFHHLISLRSTANTVTMYLFRQRLSYLPVPVHQEPPGSKSPASTTSRICRLLVLPAVAVVSCALGFSVGTRASVPACSNADSAFLQPTKLDITIPTNQHGVQVQSHLQRGSMEQ
jgi:hypothetical protein